MPPPLDRATIEEAANELERALPGHDFSPAEYRYMVDALTAIAKRAFEQAARISDWHSEPIIGGTGKASVRLSVALVALDPPEETDAKTT